MWVVSFSSRSFLIELSVSGLVCDTLTGTTCLLAMIDKKNASENMVPRLVKWFETTYTTSCGSVRSGKLPLAIP